jgi:hypothetical protein
MFVGFSSPRRQPVKIEKVEIRVFANKSQYCKTNSRTPSDRARRRNLVGEEEAVIRKPIQKLPVTCIWQASAHFAAQHQIAKHGGYPQRDYEQQRIHALKVAQKRQLQQLCYKQVTNWLQLNIKRPRKWQKPVLRIDLQ